MLAAGRDALVDALIARHEDALPRLDGDWNRGYDLGRRALALASLGRWAEAERALERAAAVDEGLGRGLNAARFALEAAVAGQSGRAQRWVDRAVLDDDDEDEDEAAVVHGCRAVARDRLGLDASQDWARLRELPPPGWFGWPRLLQVLRHAGRDEEVTHHLARLVSSGDAPHRPEDSLVPVVRVWIERFGEESTRARLASIVADREGLDVDRLVSLAHLERGDAGAAREGLAYLRRHELERLWALLPPDGRPAVAAALAERFEEHLRGHRLPAALSVADDLARLDASAARPLVARLLAPRAARHAPSLLGRRPAEATFLPLARAAERCGLDTSSIAAAAVTPLHRHDVALGRLVAHEPGDGAWAARLAGVMAAWAALPPDRDHPWDLLFALEERDDPDATLALVHQLEARHAQGGEDLLLMLVRARWGASEEAGRATPPELKERLERGASVALVASALVRRGKEARLPAFVEWVSDQERSRAIVDALEALAHPVERGRSFRAW